MSCSLDYIEYVCSQLSIVGEIRSRMMMGDYLIYIDEKPVVIVCDNICYVKKIPEIESLMVESECGSPYPGAKEHYILDIDHKEEAKMVVKILRDVLLYPKQRKKK